MTQLELTPQEQLRYARHLVMPEIGAEGQKRLKNASILIVGVGGLGNPVALYLAAAGIGRLGLIDEDRVSLSNLQRQVIFTASDVGKAKVYAARDRLIALNPEIRIDTREEALTPENAVSLIEGYDLVIDATDNFTARYLINDVCLRLKKPWVFGAIFRFEGQVSLFAPAGACYRCLYPEASRVAAAANCEQAGVLGVLPGLVGTIQAAEALKHVLAHGTSLVGRLLTIDAATMGFRSLAFEKRADCPACGTGARLTEPAPSCDFQISTQLSVQELLEQRERFLLIDLRADAASATLPNSHALTSFRMLNGLHDFGFDDELVVFCRSGEASAQVVAEMREQGYRRARHLSGGYEAWVRHRLIE